MTDDARFTLLASYNTWMNQRLYAPTATLPHDALAADRGPFSGRSWHAQPPGSQRHPLAEALCRTLDGTPMPTERDAVPSATCPRCTQARLARCGDRGMDRHAGDACPLVAAGLPEHEGRDLRTAPGWPADAPVQPPDTPSGLGHHAAVAGGRGGRRDRFGEAGAGRGVSVRNRARPAVRPAVRAGKRPRPPVL